MSQDINNNLTYRPGRRRPIKRRWRPPKVSGVLVMAACTALLFPCAVSVIAENSGQTEFGGKFGTRATVLLAQQNGGADPADPSGQGTGIDSQEKSTTNLEATPPQSTPDDLETFTPSETIEADQEVDFPYDI